MEVDHVGKYKLTSFKNKKIVPTDHNSVTLVLDLSVPTMKPKRIVNFDFRNVEGQMHFFNMTDKNRQLSEVFSTGITFQHQVKTWGKKIKRCFLCPSEQSGTGKGNIKKMKLGPSWKQERSLN